MLFINPDKIQNTLKKVNTKYKYEIQNTLNKIKILMCI